ncbi:MULTISPECIES: VOC family protein [Catenuloplanes]|uniref:Glyoxalase superfamily protein PhnB n=1 Tax=Catenuloplanes niger TaxID=587534 RepID=A0AAE3ZKX2_9ACTN|nr:VOC family protein [Catenuloplanes niger]MDR7319755.1 putative glyoxalase superfamily protein PhnB [Catenuloplanes niger]
MTFSVCIPIADRRVAYDFYTGGLGFAPAGEVAADGIPEPLQFDVGGGVRIMMVPHGGFEWAIGERRMTDGTTVGCLLTLDVPGPADVTEVFERAVAAGAAPIVTPQTQPWGTVTATFADPDGNLWEVTSPAAASG